jgi:hypothetical protein
LREDCTRILCYVKARKRESDGHDTGTGYDGWGEEPVRSIWCPTKYTVRRRGNVSAGTTRTGIGLVGFERSFLACSIAYYRHQLCSCFCLFPLCNLRLRLVEGMQASHVRCFSSVARWRRAFPYPARETAAPANNVCTVYTVHRLTHCHSFCILCTQ